MEKFLKIVFFLSFSFVLFFVLSRFGLLIVDRILYLTDVNIICLERFVLLLISLFGECVYVFLDIFLILNVKFCFLCQNKKTAFLNCKMGSMFFLSVNKWENIEIEMMCIMYIWCKIYLMSMMSMMVINNVIYNYNVCCKFINIMSKIMRYFIDNG